MGVVSFTHSGDFKNLEKFLKQMKKQDMFRSLNSLAKLGVDALASATPTDTGLTAASWSYKIESDGKQHQIIWTNDNVIEGHAPLVILLQYGHGTGTGGYVQGRDFINPAIQPIFDLIANSVWKEVENA